MNTADTLCSTSPPTSKGPAGGGNHQAGQRATDNKNTVPLCPDLSNERRQRYLDNALANECAKLAACTAGRNDAAYPAACAMGSLLPHGLDGDTAEAALWQACEKNGLAKTEPVKTRDTLRRGLDIGAREPRELPDFTAPTNNRHRRPSTVAAKEDAWRAVWEAAVAVAGLVAVYLRHRGLSGTVPPAWRFQAALAYYDADHKPLGTFPAAIAPLLQADGTQSGIHRLYLAAAGAGKAAVPEAKKALGGKQGAHIPIGGDEATADTLHLAEGPETALAVFEAIGGLTWAAVDAGNLPHQTPPPTCTRVNLWADNDDAGLKHAHEAAAKFHATGLAVYVLVPATAGTDWLEVLIDPAHGPAALRDALDAAQPWAPPPPAPPAGLVCLADVEREDVQWLWTGRLARGKLHIIAGDPCKGKSLVTLDWAARVSTGTHWPMSQECPPVGDSLLLSAEDALADTIRPRLEAAGADLRRTHSIIGPAAFGLLQDVVRLETYIASLPDCLMVVIDPLSAYLGDTDSHNNAAVRGALAPLSDLATRLRVALVLVSHLNKNSEAGAMQRVTGSLAFVAAARVAWLVVEDPQNKDRCYLGDLKNNLAPRQPTLAYRVVGVQPTHAAPQPRVEWEAAPADLVITDLLGPVRRTTRDNAAEWLRDRLGDGPALAANLERDAQTLRLSKATLRRAKTALGVVVRKAGMTGGWLWELPALDGVPAAADSPLPPEDAQGTPAPEVSTFGKSEHLRRATPPPAPASKREDAHLSTLEDAQFPPEPEVSTFDNAAYPPPAATIGGAALAAPDEVIEI